MPVSKSSKYKGYVYNERTNSLAGPFSGHDITAIASKDNSAEVYAVNEAHEVIKTDLLDLNNPKEFHHLHNCGDHKHELVHVKMYEL